MSALSTKTKARVGVKTAKQAAKHPKLVLRGAQGAKPVVRGVVKVRTRQARHQAAAVLDAGRSIGQTVFEAGRQAAQDAAQVQLSRKRTASRVAVGIVIGATAMYFLDPASGEERRRNVLGPITPNGRSGHQHNERDADAEAGGPAHPAPGHMPPEQR
jgi:hypothetical protein